MHHNDVTETASSTTDDGTWPQEILLARIVAVVIAVAAVAAAVFELIVDF
jgi:hypothetical protein